MNKKANKRCIRILHIQKLRCFSYLLVFRGNFENRKAEIHKKRKKEKQYEPSGRCCDISARLKGRDGTDSGNKYIFVIDEGCFGIL